MSEAEARAFVERFTNVWRSPRPDEFADLWHEDGTLLHPGMSAPIRGRQEIVDYVERITRIAPDISLVPIRWAASGEHVFIEWRITTAIAGTPVSWDGADRFTLRGDRATDGVAYFDTDPLWRRLDPDNERPLSLEEAAEVAASRAREQAASA